MRRRWSDHEKNFGPFTFARATTGDGHYALVLASGRDEYRDCTLRLTVRGHTLIVWLPPVLPPYRERVTAKSWDAATVARLGRNWYWREDRREIGATLSEGHLSLAYGRQSDDSRTERRWGCFLPWTQWRHVRRSLYDATGAHVWSETTPLSFDETRRHVKACPPRTFAFRDFDGAAMSATTRIEEREWRWGTGAFRWLSVFRRPRIRRSLDIAFSGETGRRKGSWKGGTIGHGIDLLPGELHEAAFRRYCAAHDMTFIAAEGGDDA